MLLREIIFYLGAAMDTIFSFRFDELTMQAILGNEKIDQRSAGNK